MTVVELRKRLIGKINHTKNNEILEEALRLIENEEVDTSIYELSKEQKSVVEEAQRQYKKGQFLSSKQADTEIDKWLGK
jgi:hypothetical protein